MQHLKILLISIIFIIGLYLIFYVNTIRKEYKFLYLKKIVLYMCTFNTVLLFLIASMYFKINLPQDFLLNRSLISKNIFSLIQIIFIIIFIYLIISISAELLEKTITKKQNILILFIFFVYFCFELIIYFIPDIMTTSKIFYFIYEYIFDNIILLEFIVLIYLLIANRNTKDQSKKELIRSFSILFLLRYICIIIIFSLYIFFSKHHILLLLISSGMLLLINLTPYLWVKYYFLKYIGVLYDSNNYSDLLNNIYITYKISDREKDIIKLILQGKTNKEIEDILFISINTVKNHIYKIFKKLGINSRHQLIKFFNIQGENKK